MKMKILLTTLFCVALSLPVFADQRTTVLTEDVTLGKVTAQLPYIDGSNIPAMEKQANAIVRTTAEKLAQQVGGGTVTYKVMLNRPSIVGLLLEAKNGGKTAYAGLNLDLTSGSEFDVTEFFVDNAEVKSALGDYKNILFGEEGFYIRSSIGANYDKFVPYGKLLPFMRIGEAGRLMQVAKLTEAAEGKTLVLEKGGLIALKLDGNPSTGYSWQMSCPSSAVSTVGRSFTIINEEKERVGTPGVELIFLAAQTPGTYDIKMEYKRTWEKISLKHFSFKVIVK